MSKICCIVAAGPSEIYIPCGAFIVAADAGIKKLEKAGIKPDLIIGDFDSLGESPTGENVMTFPVEKDDTDTMLALKEAIKRGFDTVYISGGLGGELDHTVANLQTLLYARKNGVSAFLADGIQSATIIDSASPLFFDEDMCGRCSVFAFGGDAHGVDIKGLKYEADRITLTSSFPLGVSNAFNGKKASVSVKDGYLLVIYNEKK